ncbi:MAG: ThiF family adenylyltransferase [Chromatiales bacterium]|jgi:molybdopterin/thiamine biosynthesis adenylyltransferase
MSEFDYDEAFSRNLGFVSKEEHQRLRQSEVAIAGMGAVGGEYLTALARSGIGGYRIADFDQYELANFNRQYGAAMSTLGRQKTDVMAEIAMDINPELRIRQFNQGIDESTMGDFLDGVDVLVDAVDIFEPDVHRLLINGAMQRGIPVCASLPSGYGAGMVCFRQGGMSFDDYFDYSPEMSTDEKIVQLLLGFAPKAYHLKYIDMSSVDLKRRKGPSSIAGCRLCAGLVVTQTLVAILHPQEFRGAPWFTHVDLRVNKLAHKKMHMGNRHPMQRLKKYIALKRLNQA